ncbi:MAG: hypothetical protein ACETVP_00595 [Candidatus Bathyarchaeia archaeon]
MLLQAISTTLPKECIDWVGEKVKTRTYASRSHAVEVLVLKEMQKK